MQARIILDPVAGRRAEAGFGGSSGCVAGLLANHVQPHLVVGELRTITVTVHLIRHKQGGGEFSALSP
jgi:hypothetical protein